MNTANNTSDGLLVSLLKGGSDAAFQAIYKKYLRVLFDYVRKNIQRKEDCEEIIQDVFVSLWQNREGAEIRSLRHYLFNAVRYKVIRYFQHQKVKRKYEEHYKLFEAVYEASTEPERDPAVINKKLHAALEQLPERCRQALQLRLSENLSNSEIAQRMQITKKTVEMHLLKAFQLIRTRHKEILSSG